MDEEPAAEFGFKPGALWGHDLTGVRDVHELFNGGWEHGEGHGAFARVDPLFKFLCAADASDEVDPLAGTRVLDAEERVQQTLLKSGHIEASDLVGIRCWSPRE